MAGRPATISDLFSPLQSLGTCMESHGNAIEERLNTLNASVLNCASNLSAGNKLISDATKKINKTITDSFKTLNDITRKWVSASTNTGTSMTNAITGSIGTGFANLSGIVSGLSTQITDSFKTLNDATAKLSANTVTNTDMLSAVANLNATINVISSQVEDIQKTLTGIEKHARDKKTSKGSLTVPNVSGGNTGDLFKAIVQVARDIDEISLARSILLKRKVKHIIGGMLDVLEEYKGTLDNGKLKKTSQSINVLIGVSNDIIAINKNMQKTLSVGLLAKMGAKTSKDVISNLIGLGEMIENKKRLESMKEGSALMQQISENVLSIDKVMAKGLIFVLPALVSAKLSKGIIEGILEATIQLEDKKRLKNIKEGSEYLDDIGHSLLKLDAVLALSAVLAPPAIVGTKLTKIIISSVLDAIQPLGDKKQMKGFKESTDNLKAIGYDLLWFDAVMAVSAVVAVPAMVGVALNALVIRETLLFFKPLSDKQNTKKLAEGARNMRIIGESVLWFDAAMAVGAILAIPAMVGVALNALLLKGSTELFKTLGDRDATQKVRNAAWAINLMCFSMISFTLTMLATTMISKYILTGGGGKVDGKNIIGFVTSIATFGLLFGGYYLYRKIGEPADVNRVYTGALGIMLMSTSIILFTGAVYASYLVTKSMVGSAMKDKKFDTQDLVAIASIAPIYLLMVGSYYLFRKIGEPNDVQKTLAAGMGVIVMSLGIMTFGLAMLATHQITKSIVNNWEPGKDGLAIVMDIAVLGLMFGSYYLFRKIGEPEDTKKILQGGLSILVISVGMIAFAGALYAVHQISKQIVGNWDADKDVGALIMSVGVFGMMSLSIFVFKKAGEEWTSIMKGSLAVVTMSAGIGAFGLGLEYYTKSVQNTSIGDLMMLPILLGILGAEFKMIGNNAKNIVLGSGAALAMSVATGAFGFALGFYTKSVKDSNPGTLLMLPALLGLLGIEFGLMGIPVVAMAIGIGSAAVLVMSGSLTVFGLAMGKISNVLQNTDTDTIKGFIPLIGNFAYKFAAIGLLGPMVALGAATMLIASGGIKVLAEGLKTWSGTDMSIDKLNLLCTSMDRVKLAFQGNPDGRKDENAGFFKKLGDGISGCLTAPFDTVAVSLTAVGLTIASGAITTLSLALKKWNETEFNEDKLNLLCISMDRIKLAFQGNPEGNKTENEGFFKKINKAISGAISAPFDTVAISLTASGLTIASGAISVLSSALSKWNNTNFSEDQLNTLCLAVDRIKLAFQGYPAGQKPKQNLFTRLREGISDALSSPFDLAKMQTTAIGLTMAGNSIKSLGRGLKSWEELGVTTSNIENIAMTIAALKDTFAQIGTKNGHQKSSVLKKIIGFDLSSFEMTDVERGARSVKQMGESLINISEGLVEWQEGIGTKFKDNTFMEEFATSVANVVGGLSNAFASAASDENIITEQVRKANTWFGSLFQDITRNTFNAKTKTRVEEGIKSVKNLGKTLKDIATGLKEFKELVPANDTSWIKDVAGGIGALLNGIQEPLIAFGTTDESFSMACSQASTKAAKYSAALSGVHEVSAQTVNFERHKVDVANALKNIGQIGDMVKGLAEGIKIMADTKLTKNIGEPGILDDSTFTVSGGTGAVGNIQKLVCSQLAIFMELGKKIQDLGMYEAFRDEVVQDTIKGVFKDTTTSKSIRISEGNQSYITMAVTAATGIGQVILNLAQGYEAMNKAFPTDASMINGTSRVTRSITAIMMAFNTIGESLCRNGSDVLDLIPAAVGMPDMTQKFGKVGGLSKLYVENGQDNPYTKAAENIKVIVNTLTGSIKTIGTTQKETNIIDKNASAFLRTFANVSNMAITFSDHKAGELTVHAFTADKVIPISLDTLNGEMLSQAKTNVEMVRKITSEIVSTSKTLSGLNVSSGDTFTNFASKMSKGMSTLAGVTTNIQHSTKFVETLDKAVKSKVFDNISENTTKIANSINSIDNDIFEPYAKMINALAVMADKHSEFNRMQKELYELLEKIIDKINEASTTSGNMTTSTNNNNSSASTSNKSTMQTNQVSKPVVAHLDKSSVKLDYADFMTKFKALVDSINTNNRG